MSETKIPKTNCRGCDGRDKIIRNLANGIDQMEKRAKGHFAKVVEISTKRPIKAAIAMLEKQ